jgi:hypothetical protein
MMKLKWLWIVGVCVLVGTISLLAYATKYFALIEALFGNWDFVKSAKHEAGVYYRLKVKLSYKGEPQDFDIVVGCKVLQINYTGAGRTYEVGLTPSVFGRQMTDGKGLVVRPPRACRGETTKNGDVPPDLMPLIVVYDDAGTLAFGTAYLSDDAYDSPQSVLKFGGATIERADRTAFDQFRREQSNLVSRSSYHTTEGPALLRDLNLPPARVPMGVGCYGYARFRLIGAEKEKAHALWPAERPQYWRPRTIEDQDAIDPNIQGRPVLTDHEDASPTPSNLVYSQLDFEVLNRGMPRRHPVPWDKNVRSTSPSYYPDIGGWGSLPWPADAATRAESVLRDGPHVGASIDFRGGAMRGFGYCRPIPQNFPTGVSYPDPYKSPSVHWVNLPQLNFIDGTEVANRGSGWNGPPLIVERDGFIFKPFNIGLPSTRGDV